MMDIIAFVERIAGLETDADLDGDMSGDDAASTLSSLIEEARRLSALPGSSYPAAWRWRVGPDTPWVVTDRRGFASKWITGGTRTRFRFKVKPSDPVGVLTAAGCDVRFTRPYSGRSKPIERAFRDLCEYGAKHPEFQGAYTGNTPMAKPEDYASRAVPLDVFTAVVNDVIRRHNARVGRRTRVCRGVLSFDQAYQASIATAVITRPTEAQLRMGEAFGPALTAIGAALRPLKPLWDGLVKGVGDLVGWFGRLLQPVKATDKSVGAAAESGKRFGRMLVLAFNLSPIGIFARGVMTAFRFIRGAMNWRPMETLRQAWSGVSNAVQSAWGPVTGMFGGLWSRAKGVVANGASAVVGVVARYHPLAILTRNWGPMTGWLGGLWSRTRAVVVSGVQSAFTSPLAYLAALPARFRTMGVNIIQGLAQGITAGASHVVQAVVGAANSAVQGARQTLGIRSPSRVFARIGGFTMEGLALGLSRNARQPLAAMSLLASAMIGALPAETAVVVRQAALAQPSDTRASVAVDPLVAPSAGSVMPAVLASLSPAPAVASAGARGGASGGVHIDQVLIQVSMPAGADAARQGGMAGRAAADSFRARLYDGVNG